MLTLIGLCISIMGLSVQSVTDQINKEYKLQLSYYDWEIEFTFDLRPPMYNNYKTIF